MYFRCLKIFGVSSDFLPRKSVDTDIHWAHPESLKSQIECLVILRIACLFWCWLLCHGQMAENQQTSAK